MPKTFDTQESTPRITSYHLALGAVVLLAIADSLIPRISIATLFLLPLLLTSVQGTRQKVLQLAGISVLLIFLDYPLKYWRPGENTALTLMDYRLLNRTFAAITIVMTAAILCKWITWRNRVESSQNDPSDLDQQTFLQMLAALQQAFATLIAIITSIGIFGADILTPGQYNLPLFYAIPLLTALWAKNLWLLWGMIPVLILFSVIGYIVGPPAIDVPSQWLTAVIINRTLATFIMLGTAVLLHFLIRRKSANGTSPSCLN